VKSPRSVDRHSCGSAGQFYNVFYMTGQEYDVVVVGSGAAGMVAALTAAQQGLSTLVVEKAAHYGGSTARSGGGVWIPNNEILKRDGVKDSPAAAAEYLHAIIGDVVPAEKIDTFLNRGPEMLSFVLKHSPLKLCWVPNYSDYYPESPGGKPTGRSVEPRPFNANKLGADLPGLEPPYGKVPMNMVVLQQDYVRLNQLTAPQCFEPRVEVGDLARQEMGESGARKLTADDRGALEHGPFLGSQPFDAGGQQRLDRRRHLDGGEVDRGGPALSLAFERAVLHQHAHELADEQGIALAGRQHAAGDRRRQLLGADDARGEPGGRGGFEPREHHDVGDQPARRCQRGARLA